jgi:surface antigen
VEKRDLASIWQNARKHRFAKILVPYLVVVAVFAVTLLSGAFGPSIVGAFAQTACAQGDQTYTVQPGDTLSSIAQRNNTSWQKLATHNQLANPNFIFAFQHICIPRHNVVQTPTRPANQNATMSLSSTMASAGSGNFFPYGQCTWWANERYHQLHGVYVPWVTNANAWQWSARAQESGWNVSSQPTVGAIIDLQPNVQGASWLGHVAVVESILSNGDVIASNMNWGFNSGSVVNVEFAPGPGVTFITV